MSTTDHGHWFARCAKTAQDWLLNHPGDALTTEVFDAVIGAGGVPVRRETSGDDQSEDFYLHPADSEFITELRRAGVEADSN
jgi:hypothetical protein